MLYHAESRIIVYERAEADLVPDDLLFARRGQYALVKATYGALLRLTKLELDTPDPMALYDWPIKPDDEAFETQKEVSNFMVLNPRSFVLSDMRCVDAETEYLSPTGWRRIDAYNAGRVGQYHLDGRVEFVQPSEYLVTPCKSMYRFKNRCVDQKLSTGHRVLYVGHKDKRLVISAEEVANIQNSQATGFRGKFISTFSCSGPGVDISEERLRIQVAVIADGTFPTNTLRCCIRVKKERKKIRMRALLDAAHIPYKEDQPEFKGAEGFSLFWFIAPRHDKAFTSWYWGCSNEQLKIVVDEVFHWDGSTRKANAHTFTSTLKPSADFVQYACAATGRTASLGWSEHGGYVVHARQGAVLLSLNGFKADGTKTQPLSVEPTSDGKQYCFTVPTSFLIFRRNGCIFASGNTGKTRAALWASDWLMSRSKDRVRTLIVSDLNALGDTWTHEITTNLLGRRTYAVLHGTAEKRERELGKDVDYYLLNHDGLRVGYAWPPRYGEKPVARLSRCSSLARSLLSRNDIKIVVFDEAATYRERTTTTWHAASDLLSKRAAFVWGLTGSPVPNGPLDAYGLKKLVQPSYAGSYREWEDRVTYPVSHFKREPRPEAAERVAELLTPSIRIRQEQCFTPTQLSVEMVGVTLSDEQKACMRILKRELMLTMASGEEISAVNQAALRTKFLQIACGVVYDDKHESHVIEAGGRFQSYYEQVTKAPGKVITFVPFINVQHMLHQRLNGDALQISSGLHPRKKLEVLREFLNGSSKILLSHPSPIARGVDLTSASTIIWYAPTDRTEHYIQANERINGVNQKQPRRIIRLSSCSIEKDIYDKLESNASMMGAILKLKEMVL